MKKEVVLPEVETLLSITDELNKFKEEHAGVYQELQSLVERYNAAHEMAYKAVRAKSISCGPFQLTGRPVIKYNVEKILELFGEDFFFVYGGKTKQVTVYEVDKTQMDLVCASGVIPQEQVSAIRDVQPRYYKPDRLILP